MNSIGVHGRNSSSAEAAAKRSRSICWFSRSPKARLPTWSWFCSTYTNCQAGRSRAGVPRGFLRPLSQEVLRRSIEDRVGRVQAKPVGMVFVQPEASVVDREFADPFTVRSVVVDGRPPRGVVALGEIVRRKVAQVIAVRPEVVV